MACCKCCPNLLPLEEFELGSDVLISDYKDLELPILPITDIDKLKDKIICDYLLVISELEQGKQPKLEILLEEISVVDLEDELQRIYYIVLFK